MHETWQTELKNLGYPNGVTGTPFRKVAVSNGSECANPQAFGPGANLLTYAGKANTRILGDLAGMVIFPVAAPNIAQYPLVLGVIPGRNDFNFDFYVNAQADDVSNHIYHGKITYTKSVLWLIPLTVTLTNRNYMSNASTLPYDYFPGGYYDVPLNLSDTSKTKVFFKYSITAHNEPSFNFVPTVSALDIGSDNVTLTKTDYLTKYIGATPPPAPKNTPFDNFITAFNNDKVNERHISIGRRNGDWIASELNGTPSTEDCSILCDFQFISGPSAFCENATLSVPEIPGFTYTWTVDNSFAINVYPDNHLLMITRKRPLSATLTITVEINAGDCGIFTLTKIVQFGNTFPTFAGPYDIDQHTIMGVTCLGTQYYFKATDNPAGQSYTWTLYPPPGSANFPTMYAGSTAYLTFSETGNYILRLSKTNSCGTTYMEKTINVQECVGGFRLIVSPNPAFNIINIKIDNESEDVKSFSKESNVKIELFQINTAIKQKEWIFQGNQKEWILAINDISKGMYILKVTKGNYRQSKKIIIE